MEDDSLKAWEEQRDYVIENQEELKEKYGEEYIAVKDKNVVDHDPNYNKLAQRLLNKYPKESDHVFIINVQHLLSPKIEGVEEEKEKEVEE